VFRLTGRQLNARARFVAESFLTPVRRHGHTRQACTDGPVRLNRPFVFRDVGLSRDGYGKGSASGGCVEEGRRENGCTTPSPRRWTRSISICRSEPNGTNPTPVSQSPAAFRRVTMKPVPLPQPHQRVEPHYLSGSLLALLALFYLLLFQMLCRVTERPSLGLTLPFTALGVTDKHLVMGVYLWSAFLCFFSLEIAGPTLIFT